MTRIVISGGGTGGHVFPAIAIADAVRGREPSAEILFIGARGRLEMEKVPLAGYPVEGLPVAGFIRRVTLKNVSFPFRLAASLLMAGKILRRFRPDVVVGVGGYASGPTLRMANLLKIPTLIQEQNSFPGVTNRLLAAHARTVCVAWEGMEHYFQSEKIVFTGNPVRKDLANPEEKSAEAYRYFGIGSGSKVLLVMGGSGGAATINNAITGMIRGGYPPNLAIIWQTGKHYYGALRDHPDLQPGSDSRPPGLLPHGHLVRGSEDHPVIMVPFIDRMDLAYAVAGVVVSRAGAIAISELCLAGRPVILVPSPNVAGDHQTKNAQSLVDKKAAWMVKDAEAMDKLAGMIIELTENQSIRDELRRNIASMAVPGAADRIAGEIFKLMKR